MNIKITSKDVEATEAIKAYVEKKVERLVKYFGDEFDITVTIKSQKNEQIAEIFLNAGNKYKAVTAHKDLYASIDKDIDILKENQIRTYWERQWYRESFYLLAMVDYLSRENGLPLCNDYEDIRNCTLPEPLYPWDVVLAAKLDDSLDRKEQCLKEAIPEFLRFNIIESEIRNVC